MSFVEQALRSQRKLWSSLSGQIIQKELSKKLPSLPSSRLIFLGVGSSLHAAKLIGLTVRRMMDNVDVIAGSSMTIDAEWTPRKGDWVFGLSHRGKTPVTLKALNQCREAGAFTVLVTAQGVQADADLVLETCDVEKCEPHTVGLTSAICAATTLLMGQKAQLEWQKASQVADPDLGLLRSKISQPPTVLLGEWEGEWIAREIRLKLIEMAGIQPIVFSSEEFFHGPQLLINQHRIWQVSLPGDLRTPDRGLDYQAQTSTDLSSLVSILAELQWRVLALALNLGKNPDGVSL